MPPTPNFQSLLGMTLLGPTVSTVVIILLAAALVYCLIRRRPAELSHRNDLLQKDVDERTRLLQEKTNELHKKNSELELANWNLNNSILHTRQLADDAHAANKAKSEFLATMSHEIRTPLNGVIGMNTLLSISKLDDEQKKWNRIIDQSAKTLLSTIEDILDFSKIEAGILEFEEKPFSLIECVGNILDCLAPQACEKNIELLYFIDPHFSYQFIGDEIRIRHIITNLIGNAVKFTDEGYVKLEIGIKVLPNNNESLFIKVEDSGIGISEEDQTKIFEPFTQSDSSRSRDYEGTGLGLAITKQLIKLMNGDISVESQKDEGSVFTALIPLKQGDDKNALYSRGDLPPMHASTLGFSATAQKAISKTLSSIDVVHSNADSFDDLSSSSAFQMARYCFVDWDNLRNKEIFNPSSERMKEVLRNWRFIIYTSSNSAPSQELVELKPSVTIIEKPIRVETLLAIFKQSTASTQSPDEVSLHWIQEHKSRFAASPLKILVAEDNQMNSAVTTNALKALGYKSSLAIDGEEALEMSSTNGYDLILLDLHMPHMDGIEAAKRITANFDDSTTTTIAALTAAVSENDRRACAAAGMTHFLPKPLDFRKLVEVLEDVQKQKSNN